MKSEMASFFFKPVLCLVYDSIMMARIDFKPLTSVDIRFDTIYIRKDVSN